MRIEVNREVFQIDEPLVNGEELRRIVGVPDDEVLYGKGAPHPDEVGSEDGCSYQVKLDKTFKLYQGQEFFTVAAEDVA